jgi:alpha-L-rhamnosidase
LRTSLVAALVAAMFTLPATAAAAPPPGGPSAPTALQVDNLTNPLGIDDVTPQLQWQLPTAGPVAQQQSYQVRAASDPSLLDRPDLWDSGRVASGESAGITWGGPALTSREQVTWQVRTWGPDGTVSAWSAPARFEMGLLRPADWSAQWIGNPQWLDRQPTPVTVTIPAQDTRYIRLTTTRLGLPLLESAGHLYYRVQLAEIVVRDSAHPGTDAALGASVVASDPKTYPGKWEPRFLTDGSLTSNKAPFGYSSSAYSNDTPASPVALTIDLGQVRHVDELLLYGRTDTTTADGRTPNFPRDYTVTSSVDGSTWRSDADVTDQKEPPAYNLDYPRLPLFAKQFSADKPIRSARLYATGVGIAAFRLNGAQVSDAVLEPGNTDYHDRVEYATEDVTSLLRPGANSLSARLGTGIAVVPDFPDRYTKWSGVLSQPKLIAQLEITYADGSVQRIVSDDSWRTALGATTFSQWYGGEDFDARLVDHGWDQPGANLSGWQPAETTGPPTPTTALTALMAPPVEPVGRVHTVAITQPQPGTYVFDLGVNFAGWEELHVAGPAGTTLTLKPGERLGSDGLVDQSTMQKGGSTYPPTVDHYTLAGTGTETWHPDFVYHGFRYLQVTGLPTAASSSMVDGIVLRAANESAGSFSTSNDLLNRIHSLVNRSVQGNMYSLLTDCPDREKLGWLEQDWLEFGTVAANYDVAAYYRDLVRNMAEAQEANGMVPAIAPLVYNVFGGNPDQVGEPNWGSAMIQAPWQMYLTYGDVQTLRTYYSNMQRYLGYLQGRAQGNLLDYGLGDWGATDTSTPSGVTASYGYYQDAATMARIADVIGNGADAQSYRSLASDIASAYNAKYLDAAHHTYANGTQADDALALDMGIVPASERQAVLDHLIAGIRAAGNHLTVGEIALPSVFRVLSAAGDDEVLYDVATQVTSPSYGYSVVNGATALPEYWDGATGYGSQDHFMMGAIDQWFTAAVGGISQAPGSVAYRQLLIAPRVVGDLTAADASYRTPYGTARSSWRIEGQDFLLDVTVPGNSSATVVVPQWLGQESASVPPGATVLGRTATTVSYAVGPGDWHFTAHVPAPRHTDTVQVALTPPAAAVPVIADRTTTTTFSAFNLAARAVTVQPAVTVSAGFAATTPSPVTLPPGTSVAIPVQVSRTSADATTGSLHLTVGDATAEVAVQGTDDLARVATMTASSTHGGWDPARTNDGDTAAQADYDLWNSGEGWNDNTSRAWPDWLAATWDSPETVSTVRVLTLDSDRQSAADYGLRDYDVQALVAGDWTTVASVSGNTAGTITSTFAPVRATAIRLLITDSNDHTYSRVVELEAFA